MELIGVVTKRTNENFLNNSGIYPVLPAYAEGLRVWYKDLSYSLKILRSYLYEIYFDLGEDYEYEIEEFIAKYCWGLLDIYDIESKVLPVMNSYAFAEDMIGLFHDKNKLNIEIDESVNPKDDSIYISGIMFPDKKVYIGRNQFLFKALMSYYLKNPKSIDSLVLSRCLAEIHQFDYAEKFLRESDNKNVDDILRLININEDLVDAYEIRKNTGII